jgi:SpoVK/Ycf46/Vps4 family AAA+-type ATPase
MTAAARPYGDNFEHLRDELRRLDLLIGLRVAEIKLRNQFMPEAQLARTVYITADEVQWLLSVDDDGAYDAAAVQEPRAALNSLSADIEARIERSLVDGVHLALPVLSELLGLSPVEQRAVIVCLAPELRSKYDRLYAYLQDDITRKRASVDLVLQLACDTEAERWRARGLFAEPAPLLRAGMLQKITDPHSPSGSSGLAEFLALDPRVCQFLLGNNNVDARLAGWTRLHQPQSAGGVLTPDIAAAGKVRRLAERQLKSESANRRSLVLYLHGPAGVGKRDIARNACRHLGVPLLEIDADGLLAAGPEAEKLCRLVFRESLLQQAAVYLAGADVLQQDAARSILRSLQVAVAEYGWMVFLSGESSWPATDTFPNCVFQPVDVPIPDVPTRTTMWQRSLTGLTPDTKAWATQLANAFQLTPERIRAAVDRADSSRRMEPEPRPLTLADVAAACRQLSNQELGKLAVKIEPQCGWADLVLPSEKLALLREICNQIRHHYRVYESWGFGAKHSRGTGLSVLFSGPPGTGKTLAADVLANEVGLTLYKIDLSNVVSKYIGETEKNLARIFAEAETSNSILFFDEADALFGKRTEVSNAHDRYANIETSYLLQKMEEQDGVVILATNLRHNMDEAFTRRIRFIVEFPFPEADSRMRIWETLFPPAAPVSDEIDFAYLAREFAVAGGSIKNIVLNAAFLAAANGGTIGTRQILQGTRREYEKIGKLWSGPSSTSESGSR